MGIALSRVANVMREVRVNIPELATKQLKLRTCKGNKRATVSSNWLMLYGFDGTKKVVEESLGKGKGIKVRLADQSDENVKSVYVRTYKSRSANPLNPVTGRKERVVEISSKVLINEALGENCSHVHVTFKHGVLFFQPVEEAQYSLLQKLDCNSKINTLVAMTGGVDCHTLEKGGYKVQAAISFRPQEKRDSADYTEFDCVSTLINSAPRLLINEDIYSVCPERLAKLLRRTPITVGHFSLTCEEFSLLKTNKAKNTSLDDLSSTVDMFIPLLNILKRIKFPVLVVENVEGFLKSAANDILTLQLKRLGYKIHQGIYKAEQHGGNSLRKRMYMVATTLDAPLIMPEADIRESANVWEKIILPNWNEIKERDVTDTKVMQDAISTGRYRVIRETRPFSPTLTRAQSQDSKDAIVVEREGRYYRLPVSVQMAINNIPDSFDLDWAPLDKAAQIIGQSICCSLHKRIMDSVRNHILDAAARMKSKFDAVQISLSI